MAVRNSRIQSSRNSRTNLSDTKEDNRTKQTYSHSIKQQHRTAKIHKLQNKACKPAKLKIREKNQA